jgi:hypothetical protein
MKVVAQIGSFLEEYSALAFKGNKNWAGTTSIALCNLQKQRKETKENQVARLDKNFLI